LTALKREFGRAVPGGCAFAIRDSGRNSEAVQLFCRAWQLPRVSSRKRDESVQVYFFRTLCRLESGLLQQIKGICMRQRS
jgi:hypothetical protein